MPTLRVLSLVCMTLWCVACQADRTPELLSVAGFSPDRLEVGDRVEISGAGFARGRKANVRFRGEVFRAGARPTHVDVTLTGRATSSRTIELGIDPEVEQRTCGAGDVSPARHATLRGSVTVAFAPREPGAPPVRGTLDDVVIDVFPRSRNAEQVEQEVDDGRKVLQFLGVSRVEVDRYGVKIADLDPEGAAFRRGLTVGDTITVFGNVRVLTEADVAPPPGVRTVRLTVQHEGGGERDVEFDLDGFRAMVPDRLSQAGWILAAAAFALWLWFLGARRLVTWAQWRRSRRLTETEGGKRRIPRAIGGRSLRVVQGLTLAVAVAFLMQPAFGRSWFSSTVDMLLSFGVVVLAQAIGVLVSGGRRESGWSLMGGFAALFEALCVSLPGAIALVALVLSTGTADCAQLVAQQGAMPWQWRAFESPVSLVAFCLWMFGALPRPEVFERALESSDAVQHASLRPWLAVATACYAQWVVCFGVVAFLGGWKLPVVSSSTVGAVAVAAFASKALALHWLVERVRRWFALTTPKHFLAFALKWAFPASALVLALSVDWPTFRAHPLGEWFAVAVRPLALVLAVALPVLALMARRSPPDSNDNQAINPWL